VNEKSIQQNFAQLKSFVAGLKPRQRLMLAGGAVVIGTVLWGLVGLSAKTEMKTLYSGLAASDAQSVANQLAAKKIAYEITSDGTGIRVPADQLDKLRLEMAAQGMPQSGRLGFELFDKPNWSGSDFGDRVNYQRALEGELERTIQTIRGVEGVRVHLVLPRESLFTEREREAKAAVVLRFSGARIDEETGRAITNLVASSVDNLRPQNVTVVNAQGRSLVHNESGSPQGAELEKQLTHKLLAALEPIVGPDRVQANVTVEYDLASSEDTKEIYDPTSVVPISREMSDERNGAGQESAGVPGTSSNLPGKQQDIVPVDGEDRIAHSERGNFAVNKTVRHTVQPAGQLKRVTAAVLLDDETSEAKDARGKVVEQRRKRSPEDLKQIEELAKASIGFDANRGDVLVVENIAFHPSASVDVPTAGLPEKIQETAEKWSTAVRYGVLIALFLIVFFFVLRPIQQQFVTSFRQVPAQLAAAGSINAAGAISSGSVSIPLPQGVTEEPTRTVTLKRQLVEKVKKEPESASRLVLNWIRQSEASK